MEQNLKTNGNEPEKKVSVWRTILYCGMALYLLVMLCAIVWGIFSAFGYALDLVRIWINGSSFNKNLVLY